jgi:hypothetical protein
VPIRTRATASSSRLEDHFDAAVFLVAEGLVEFWTFFERCAVRDDSDRKELERRLEQARRMSKEGLDLITKERLAQLIRDIEEELR